MLTSVALAYVFGAVAVVVVSGLCVFLVRYYMDRHDSEAIPTIVTIVSLSLVLCCVVLIPVDIFAVSNTAVPYGSSSASSGAAVGSSLARYAAPSTAIKYIYYTVYGLLTLCVFLVIPFAYFYYEEYDEDITTRRRIFGALKYTILLVVIVLILLIIGLFVKTGSSGSMSGVPTEWFDQLKKAANSFEGAIGFIIGSMTLIGFVVWLTYTAYGMSSLAFGFIRGRRHVTEEISETQSNLEMARQKQRMINAKYASGVKVSKKDEQQLSLLRQQERIYEQHNNRLARETGGKLQRCLKWFKPLLIVAGVLFLLISVLLVVSIVMTQVDKILTSKCGYKCGYILTLPKINNPLDQLLVILADYFPLDSIVLAAVVAYFFFSTLSGICNIGIRFLWIELFRVHPHSTPPQGLLLTAVFLTLSVLALSQELLSLAPRYVSFGTQTYFVNGTKTLCDMHAPVHQCHMTQIATFLNVVTGVNQSFLGVIFYYGTWLFVLAWIVGAFVAFFKRKAANVVVTEEEVDDDEIESRRV